MPQNVPTIIRGDFNVDILTETCQSMTSHNIMNTQKFKLFFFEYTTINKMQINHISPNKKGIMIPNPPLSRLFI